MKKQKKEVSINLNSSKQKPTTYEENMDMDIVPDIVSFNLGWDTCQKQQKSGYNQADVEKIIDKDFVMSILNEDVVIDEENGIKFIDVEGVKLKFNKQLAKLNGEKTHNGN